MRDTAKDVTETIAKLRAGVEGSKLAGRPYHFLGMTIKEWEWLLAEIDEAKKSREALGRP